MKNKLFLLITFSAILQVAVALQGYPQSSSIPEGSWRNQSFGDRTMHMLLVQKQGDTTKQFDMGFKGSIIGNSGKVLSFDGTIQTLADEAGNTTKVLKTELKDGTLVISTEDGQTYVIYDLNPNGGMIKTEPNPSAQPMTKVSQLISQLNDPDFGVRLNAAYELGESKDPSAVEPLINALKDTDMNVRQGVAGALGKIQDPRAVEPLIAALSDTDSRVRRVAAEALGDIKDPRAIEPLIAARRDPDADVQRRAAEALDEIKDAHKAVASSKAAMPATAVSNQPTATPATSTATTKKAVQEAQKRLQALGYQPGSADGVMGARAIAALKKFQSDHHLPATGTLDQRTLDALAAPAKSAATTKEAEGSKSVGVDQASGLRVRNSTTATASPKVSAPIQKAQPEEYHVLYPARAGFKIVLEMKNIRVNNADGSVLGGEISAANIDDQPSNAVQGNLYPIELVSNELTDSKIHTTQFGDLLVDAPDFPGVLIMMTDSQIKKVQSFLNARKSDAKH